MTRTKRTFDQARRLVRDYTGEETVVEFKRLFDRDAAEAYEVLSRDHRGEEPEDEMERSAYRIKIFLLGLASKLSPARRVLFALGLALFGWMVLDIFFDFEEMPPLVMAFDNLADLAVAAIFFFLFTMELVDRVRVRDELEVAKVLQSDLLPRRAPRLDDYRFGHSYRTANEVGGDYYDFLPLADGRIALVVGDASGHGMAAGLLMAIANATLQTAIDVDPEPARVVEILNRTLVKTGDRRAFMSMFYSVLTPDTGELEYICAGHPFPLLRRGDGALEELGDGALPLGIKEGLGLTSRRTRLEPDDVLVLYSDGLVEAVRGDGEAFGYQRLASLLERSATPQALHDRIMAEFDGFVGDQRLHDDLTLVVMARAGATPPPPPV